MKVSHKHESGHPRITAKEIISEILNNMREGAEEMYSETLVPSFYQVFLHESDFQRIQPIEPHLIADAKTALSGALENLNRRRLVDKLTRTSTTFKCASKEWQIEMFQDPDQEVLPGTVRIQSHLVLPERRGTGAGAATRFTITRTADLSPTPNDEIRVMPNMPPVLAEFKYEAEHQLEKAVRMVRAEFLIGRGGPDVTVDLQLSNPSVSEIHARVRRNSLTGAFLLENCGRFGTTVDGRLVPKGAEVVLPLTARIGLANDTSIVEFRAMG